jgi:HPt (histidine-containing phosphotransfer) domain-containing protein
MSDRIIDWTSLIDVCGEEDMVDELVQASLEDGVESLGLLRRAVQAEDLETIELYAHRLKGVSMIMGAATLRPLAYALEQAGNEGRLEDIPGLFSRILETFDQVSAFLSQDNWIELAKQQALIPKPVS